MAIYTDQTLSCVDCGATFQFTAGDQEFFAEKGFLNTPRRCKSCRYEAKSRRGTRDGADHGSGFSSPRELHGVICDGCGLATQVPFVPNGSKPVYCRDCFRR